MALAADAALGKPILDGEAGDPAELQGVVGHQGSAQAKSGHANLGVERPDRRSGQSLRLFLCLFDDFLTTS